LQYKSGDALETDELNRRIMSLYALGYFENIHYDLTPLGDKQVELRIHVHELPRSRLRVGLHYDNYHRVVTTAAIRANNLIFPGLRLENEIQLGGRSRIMAKASYPSRAMNLPAYPFIRLGYRSYPAEIFGGDGTRLVSFHDRSWIFGAGLGLQFEKWFNSEFEYRMEWMDAAPKVVSEQSGIAPSWKDNLYLLCGRMTMDTRDDVSLPREGFHLEARVEGSFKRLGSETPYRKLDVLASIYQSFSNLHTFRLMGYWAEADSGLPLYKSFNMGRPEYFVGMKYDQLAGRRMKIIRLDYRFRINNFLHAELAGNLALDVEQRLPSEVNQAGRLWGMGVGLLIDTPVGPLRFMTSSGSRGLLKPTHTQNQFYIVLGARF
jgi:NTE family protein